MKTWTVKISLKYIMLPIGSHQTWILLLYYFQGAAAQGANPVYANDVDVLVPVLYPGTHEVEKTEDTVIKANFKSEVSFKTAYSGVVTRKVIMEERNVFCGAYNVMVLSNM